MVHYRLHVVPQAPFQSCLKKLTQIPSFIGIQVFGGLAIILGFLTFAVPGIYLAVAYVFSGMAMVDRPQSSVGQTTLV